jgi:hypothetical protein
MQANIFGEVEAYSLTIDVAAKLLTFRLQLFVIGLRLVT